MTLPACKDCIANLPCGRWSGQFEGISWQGCEAGGVEIYPVQKQKSLGRGVSVSKLLVQKGQSKWKGSRYKFEPWTGIIESK